jgi:hypothetical protein
MFTIGDVLEHKNPAPKPLKKKYWCGNAPKVCQICHEPIEHVFVDGSTKMGPWAIMCEGCHLDVGRGLGIGKGQKYQREGSGVHHSFDKFVKVGE